MTGSPAAEAAATMPARTVFFGSGSFAIPILAALLELPGVRVVGVVTAPDRPAGRGRTLSAPPVAGLAAARNLPLLQPATLRDPSAVAEIAERRPVLGVVADYGRLVPTTILSLPGRGFLNVHPSLLPRHRGAAPIAGAILAGDREAGVSIMAMDTGLDTGPVVAQVAWPLAGTETAGEVEETAAAAGARLLAETIPAWLAGRAEARAQDEVGATLTRPLRREDGRLDPSQAATDLERRVRAYEPWPGTFIELVPDDGRGGEPHRVAVLRAASTADGSGDTTTDREPGHLVRTERGVALQTSSGRLELLEVRPAGGRSMSGVAWLRGRPGLVDARVIGGEAEAVR